MHPVEPFIPPTPPPPRYFRPYRSECHPNYPAPGSQTIARSSVSRHPPRHKPESAAAHPDSSQPRYSRYKATSHQEKTQANRLLNIADHHCRHLCLRIKPVNIRRKFKSSSMPFVSRHNPVPRIGKPDSPIRMSHQVIRSIQLLALKRIHQHRNSAGHTRSASPAASRAHT